MKKTITLVLIIKLFLLAGSAWAQEAAGTTEGAYQSFFSTSQSFDSDGTELYNTNYHLKSHKKVGFGVALGGIYGNYGIHSELNLDPMTALVLGLGAGPGYGTFNLQGKWNWEAYYLSPYIKAGYSRWFSSGGGSNQAQNSDVLKQIHSQVDLRNGKFDSGFMVGSIGAEYNQLEGELSGFNFFGEVTLMTETAALKVVPVGSVGLTYFY